MLIFEVGCCKYSKGFGDLSENNTDIRFVMRPMLFYYLLGICIFAYLCLRAYGVPITHDEAGSFLEFVHLPVSDIILGNPSSSTNHIFHTLLVKASSHLFGNHVFFLRLPILLAYLAYFFFSLQLLQRWTNNSKWILLGLILLNFPPYLLEFFSLSRGYGLGIGCMMASLYYLSCFITELQQRQLIAGFTLAALAVYSNFVFGLYFTSLGLIIGGYVFIHWRKSHSNAILISSYTTLAFVSLVLALVIWMPLKGLLASGGLYIGGETGFGADTVGSLIRWNLYGQSYFEVYDLEVIGGSLLAGLGLIFGGIAWELKNREAHSREKWSKEFRFLAGVLVVLVGIQCAYVWLFGGKYLVGRTALFLVPLIILFLFAGMYHWRRFRFVQFLTIGFAFLLVSHFVQTANISRSHEWSLDAATPPMLNFVAQEAMEKGEVVSLGVHWLMLPSVGYYQQVASIDLVKIRGGKELIPDRYDYYFMHEKHAEPYLDGYRIQRRFGVHGGLWLLEKE